MMAIFGKKVGEEQDAWDFLRWCVANLGVGFHPDTRFEEYQDETTGRPVYHPHEAAWLNDQMGRVFDLLPDPYEVALAVMEK
jgi:hypothetical protein